MAITQLHQQRLQDQTIYSSMAKQAIINGNFDIWQRGTTRTDTVAFNAYLADRYNLAQFADTGTLPTMINSRQVITSGDLPQSHYCFRLNVSGAGTGLGANSFDIRQQSIENGTRNLAGNGRKVTVSFWARSSIVGKKIGVDMNQTYGTGGSPSSAEALNGTNWTLTSTWTKYTYTFTTNTLVGKTFGTNGNDYLLLRIWNMWGSTQATKVGAVGAETYVGSGDIDLAQVQLCAGDEALPFEPKTYAEELTACQRYYTRFDNANGGVAAPWGNGVHTTATTSAILVHLPTPMRLPFPPILSSATGTIAVTQVGVGRVYNTAIAIQDATPTTLEVQVTVAGGLTAGQGTFGTFANGATNYVAFETEL